MAPGSDLDSWSAQHQTRDLLRDAPVRLGVMAGVVSILGGLLVTADGGIAVPWGWVLAGGVAIGLLTGWAATRLSDNAANRRESSRHADRDRRKAAELAQFVADRQETEGKDS